MSVYKCMRMSYRTPWFLLEVVHVAWIALIITTSGTVSLQPQSSFCGLPLHWSWQCTDHACKEGEDILLSESSVTILQPNFAPNLRGFIPERMRLHPVWWKRQCEDTTVLRFCKADSGWSPWQESLSHTHVDSDPLISLRKNIFRAHSPHYSTEKALLSM